MSEVATHVRSREDAAVFNFGLVGAAGFVAPRHLKAIAETGNRLVAAMDPHDSVGVIDSYFPECAFFTEAERFDRFLEKRRRLSEAERVHYISVCSPNYLHDAHVRLALRVGAHAICEKPLVISPWNLDQLAALEAEFDRKVYTVLQLRELPQLRALRAELLALPTNHRADVDLTYVTARGPWYGVSWKGNPEKSGGLCHNIGVHFFDLLIWLYGTPTSSSVFLSEPTKMSGVFELERARVRWFLSVDGSDLPLATRAAGKTAFRSITADGRNLEFSTGFVDGHTEVYREILAGRGARIADVRPCLELAHAIRNARLEAPTSNAHPFMV
ncbi:MAG TPA: Gfo/Idh/MocA family oxidoreductase [Kofleriaceae bacterium]|jgi:UDP-N-acetyl-2-amino-2-deoxyglucuronate dehydrogenase